MVCSNWCVTISTGITRFCVQNQWRSWVCVLTLQYALGLLGFWGFFLNMSRTLIRLWGRKCLRVYRNAFLALCPIIWGRYSGKILWRFGTLPLSVYRPMEEQRQRYGPPLYKLTSFVVLLRVFLVVWWSSFNSTDMYNSLTLSLSLCRSKWLFPCLHPYKYFK